jgi:2,3-bisphosphoglycerate-independent phosphoglycerate mutase
MTKILFLVADGMGDWPLEELGNKTPLEVAETPALDELAKKSRLGLCQTIPRGMPPGSDIANMALLGYNPAVYHTGRGPIEAAAQGLELNTDDLVWRCNLVTLTGLGQEDKMIDYAAGHLETDQATSLIHGLRKINKNSEFVFYPGVQYRHLLVQKNGMLTKAADMHIRPPHDILGESIWPDILSFQEYPALWELVSKAYEFLTTSDNPTQATSIWPWGQGRPLSLPAFSDKFNLKGGVISAVDLIKGLGRAAGLSVIDVPGATGLLDTNYAGKVASTLKFLENGDFIFVHLEGPDECGHMGNVQDKIEAIKRFDQLIVAPILQSLKGEDFTLVVCCDHLTPIAKRTHVSEPVPFLIYNSQKEVQGEDVFSEKTAKKTGLFIEKGYELLNSVIGS